MTRGATPEQAAWLRHWSDCVDQSRISVTRKTARCGCCGRWAELPPWLLDRPAQAPTTPASTAEQAPRYGLTCVRCDKQIRTDNPRKRIPLCDRCRNRPRPPKENQT